MQVPQEAMQLLLQGALPTELIGSIQLGFVSGKMGGLRCFLSPIFLSLPAFRPTPKVFFYSPGKTQTFSPHPAAYLLYLVNGIIWFPTGHMPEPLHMQTYPMDADSFTLSPL